MAPRKRLSSWFHLTVQIPATQSDRLSSLMFDLGSSGLEVDDSEVASVRLTAYFPKDAGRDIVLTRVTRELESVPCGSVVGGVSDVPDEDWDAKWRDHFEPVYPTDRMVIHPPWREVSKPENGFSLVIEPKMAFGTGSHPTTRMSLIALEDVVRPGDRVLDVGAGSGILSIAAIRLGASEVLAVDTDPLATENVVENARLNKVTGIRAETRCLTGTDTGYDVTVANIIRNVLTPMLPLLEASVRDRGHVILGGLLDSEESPFVETAEGASLDIVEITREAEWVGFITRTAR